MARIRIAVPTDAPGGLEAKRSDHFGHCDVFTLVDIVDDKIVEVAKMENAGHGAGGCMEPVGLLKESGIDAIVVGGMGARPLQGFASVGINVYFADRQAYADVRAVVDGMLRKVLLLMHPSQACQGHANCHGHGH